jgi:hypothetical protein
MDWIRFNEWCARHSSRGRIRDSDGTHSAWSHTRLIINNLTTPSGPFTSTDELKACGFAAVAGAGAHPPPWMFGVPEPWLPCGVEAAGAALEPAGMNYLMYMTSMEAGSPLAEPLRSLPVDVEVRRVTSSAAKFDALNLNSRAYGLPVEVTKDVLDSNTYFSDPEKEFGFVVYNREGTPVSTATGIDLGNCMYIAAVATDAAHRQKGYAELAIRAVLAAGPPKPTSLDASRTGEPLYAQMGYRRKYKWHFWAIK